MDKNWNFSEPQIMDKVYREFSSRVFGFMYKRIGDDFIAEDLTSIVFLRILESGHTFDPEKAILPVWIFAIAHNILIDYYRKNKTNLLISEISETLVDKINLEESSELKQTKHIILECINQLSESEQKIMIMRYFEGYGNREISAILQINENTVSSLHRRSLIKLRKSLAHKDLFD